MADKRGPQGEIHRAVVLDWREQTYVQVALKDLKENLDRGCSAETKEEIDAILERLDKVWEGI